MLIKIFRIVLLFIYFIIWREDISPPSRFPVPFLVLTSHFQVSFMTNWIKSGCEHDSCEMDMKMILLLQMSKILLCDNKQIEMKNV
jgi:hypothetical protein